MAQAITEKNKNTNIPNHITTMKTTLRTLITTALLGLSLSACSTPKTHTSTQGTKRYPLTQCIVTDNDLASMGGAITKVYNGQEIKFCCKPCIKKFEANQAKYLAKIK